MRSVIERSVRLVTAFLHEYMRSLRGSRKCYIRSVLYLSFVWCGYYQELQYKSLHRGLLLPWRRWYRHLLKTYGHGFLQKVKVLVVMYVSKM
jgi:hypothetical protein